ncbi:MAG: tRNA 2-thiouridine(34) synthase MnmA [Candidatus Pacebacteria bacterium]|nr:tRNA 2-thiouridine(34) synthase MnmA [Candidatus Paceibacterota bacterium]
MEIHITLEEMFSKNKKNKKVLVAMSGGVDSSVAALLLQKQGYRVIGGFIRGYNVDGCQDKEGEDARRVAQHLGIPFYVFDLEKEYKQRVVSYLLDGYRKGITPNPDVVCNSAIKFGLFFDKAIELGADYVASGHYARLKTKVSFGKWLIQKEHALYQANDLSKDQTYFLWQVPRERFEKILFPIGHLTKKKVRAIARKAGIPTADKKDSQGVCFLGKFKFDEFLKNNIPITHGDIIDMHGKKVGEHDGVWFYTVGQKHGFSNTAGKSYYVVKKDITRNQLIVAYEGDECLYGNECAITDINWLDSASRATYDHKQRVNCLVRVRYRQRLLRATLVGAGSTQNGTLLFGSKEKLFPASGQSAVFYSHWGRALGGGVIQ